MIQNRVQARVRKCLSTLCNFRKYSKTGVEYEGGSLSLEYCTKNVAVRGFCACSFDENPSALIQSEIHVLTTRDFETFFMVFHSRKISCIVLKS